MENELLTWRVLDRGGRTGQIEIFRHKGAHRSNLRVCTFNLQNSVRVIYVLLSHYNWAKSNCSIDLTNTTELSYI